MHAQHTDWMLSQDFDSLNPEIYQRLEHIDQGVPQVGSAVQSSRISIALSQMYLDFI